MITTKMGVFHNEDLTLSLDRRPETIRKCLEVSLKKPGTDYKDEEGMQTMRILGKNMAYFLRCMEAGRQLCIDQPETEAVTFTNFIRE